MGESQEYGGVNDHLHWTKDKWKAEVAADRTDMGYRAWIFSSLEGEAYAKFYGPQPPVRPKSYSE